MLKGSFVPWYLLAIFSVFICSVFITCRRVCAPTSTGTGCGRGSPIVLSLVMPKPVANTNAVGKVSECHLNTGC